MELKSCSIEFRNRPVDLLIAPLMELKLSVGVDTNPVRAAFNRTAYGIEICLTLEPWSHMMLLIAPLMELK